MFSLIKMRISRVFEKEFASGNIILPFFFLKAETERETNNAQGSNTTSKIS